MKKETLKSKTTIVDESMKPFFLQVDDFSYNVCENAIPKEGGDDYTVIHSYHQNLATALQAVVQRKVKSKKGLINLKVYIGEIKAITEIIAKAVYTAENMNLKS